MSTWLYSNSHFLTNKENDNNNENNSSPNKPRKSHQRTISVYPKIKSYRPYEDSITYTFRKLVRCLTEWLLLCYYKIDFLYISQFVPLRLAVLNVTWDTFFRVYKAQDKQLPACLYVTHAPHKLDFMDCHRTCASILSDSYDDAKTTKFSYPLSWIYHYYFFAHSSVVVPIKYSLCFCSKVNEWMRLICGVLSCRQFSIIKWIFIEVDTLYSWLGWDH